MGSASRQALTAAKAELSAFNGHVPLEAAQQLFEAARVIDGQAQLRSALSDPSIDAGTKRALVSRVFARFDVAAVRLLTVIVGHRWSSPADLVAGIEEVGVRAIATAAAPDVSIETELQAFGAVVSSDAQLELALGSKLAAADSKVALVQRLLEGKASAETLAILRQLVAHPRGRRIPELVRFAAGVVADQGGFTIATVSVAAPLAPEQLDRLRSALSRQYSRPVSVNVLIDPSLLGGMRLHVGDEVIDGTVSARLSDLKLQLAS
ncbi:ATP synthase F1 subcomplex delta subunit [Rathayibacter oskolensis]|uniref:ATP synthase subunit delta n=1 Tax=Rathayibacter oskolensis TaxID=1891671 RepID=A0A1X7ND33_9MICO|nr:F0F1 ATP synthase subunit delta [Rathayibacter oskolensis]SMH34822.1 ATP synthase F1 subcomplex delta subunit [Rathayibacter oskolensis]